MDIGSAITVLKAIGPIASVVPVAGAGLEAMLRVTIQLCEVVEVSEPMATAEFNKSAKPVAEYQSQPSGVCEIGQRDRWVHIGHFESDPGGSAILAWLRKHF